jgi:hypothetical protein
LAVIDLAAIAFGGPLSTTLILFELAGVKKAVLRPRRPTNIAGPRLFPPLFRCFQKRDNKAAMPEQ